MQVTISRSLSSVFAASLIAVGASWSHVARSASSPGSRPGDASLTCTQIAQELQPYMQRMSPSVTALGQTAQEAKTRGEERNRQAAAEAAEETAAARATMLDPTGLASKILGQEQVRRQKERWKQSEAENKPLEEKMKAQTGQVVAQAQPLQSDARLHRLMELAQEKNCH
jgi:hypothetical protein